MAFPGNSAGPGSIYFRKSAKRPKGLFASVAAILADLAAGKLVCHTGPAHWRIVFHCETRFRAAVQTRMDAAGVIWGPVPD